MTESQSALVAKSVKIELWRMAVVVLMFGMIAAISFIEAPLKFQAPGITIPLGLGIGRLVFTALNIATGLLLLIYVLLTLFPAPVRVRERKRSVLSVCMVVLFAFEVGIIRPLLNARTDQVLAGAEPGKSPWHYIYIVCDMAMLVLLVLAAVWAAKAVVLAVREAAK